MVGSASGQQTVRLVWRGETFPIAVSRGDFSVGDVARSLGLTVSRDTTTGTLTITAKSGGQLLAGPGMVQVAVGQKVVGISREVRSVAGVLYAPADFFEKALFPLAGAAGTWDPGQKLWTATPAGGAAPGSAPAAAPAADPGAPVAVQVDVVHVEPTTQVVLRESVAARFEPLLVESGLQIRWTDRKVVPPFTERRFDDPLVAAVRFEGDTVTVVFRNPSLRAHAYPLTDPDRIVVEVASVVESPPIEPAAPPPPPVPALTIVIDPGHGGTETGAIGPNGLQEKDVTLQIARRLAAAIPRVVSSRVVLTRDSDSAISLDDRTSLANHERAGLFLSLHANSSRAVGAHGSETYYLSLDTSDRVSQDIARRENLAPAAAPESPAANPDLDFILWDMAQSAHITESSRLAEAIQTQLNVVSKTENRGIKQAPFRVLAGATMPAVLVEVGFISHPDEEKQLRSAAFQESVAVAIAKAVGEFFNRRQLGTTPAVGAAVTPAPVRSPGATPSPGR